MCVQLWVEFAAGVVPVCGDSPVGSRAIFVCSIESDTRSSIALSLCKGFSDSIVMSRDQALIPADKRLYGN
jgi:hypothetical protein